MDELLQRLEQLAARVEVLESENAALRGRREVVSTRVQPESSQGDVRVGRRGLLGKAVGMAAVGAVGASLLEASPAAASTGDALVLGSTSNSAANYTQLTCTDSNSALYVVGQGGSGISYTAAVLGDTNSYNGIAGVTSADPAVGVYGVSHARSGLGYAPAAVFGDSDKYQGVYGESAQSDGVFGETSSLNYTVAGVHGKGPSIGVLADSPYIGLSVPGNGKYGVISVAKMQAGATGVLGQVGYDGNYGPGAQGSMGVLGKCNSLNSVGYGVYGLHGGSGVGVYGTSRNPAGTGVQGQATTGVRGTGDSTSGGIGVLGEGCVAVRGNGVARGAVLKGAAAQLQLVAGAAATHPTSGQTGDFYVDKYANLWFCKTGGTTAVWKQIA